MASKFFISYRRNDSASSAGRIHERLSREFGHDLLFIDVDNVAIGKNFISTLREAIGKCDMLLAIIGRNWITARDKMGRRRLDDPNDFVRLEIATALKRRIPVIPVFVDGAQIPQGNELPRSLKKLVQHQGVHVRHVSFAGDMDQLIQGLKALDQGDEKQFRWSEQHNEQYNTYGIVEIGQMVTVLRPPRTQATALGATVLQKGIVTRRRDRA